MAKNTIEELETVLNSAAGALPKVTSKRMFGCHALWADGNVFALVWKHGRIGFKLPNESAYQTLLGVAGAAPWKAGPMTMTHWVLVPESYHAKSNEMKKWASKAHDLCSKLEQKPKKAAGKKTAAKKVAKKKP